MAKRLIDRKSLQSFDFSNYKEFVVEPDMILTPSAKDLLNEHQIPVVYPKQNGYAPKPQQPDQQLTEQIVRILVEDYGVNAEEIPSLVQRILSKLA